MHFLFEIKNKNVYILASHLLESFDSAKKQPISLNSAGLWPLGSIVTELIKFVS